MYKRKIIVVGLIVTIVAVLLILISKNSVNFNMEDVRKDLLLRYPDLELLDREKISTYFGIDIREVESSIFMSDYVKNDDNLIFSPTTLIIVIRDKEVSKYYNFLKGYLDSNKNNTDIDNSLYENAIIEKKNNALYLVLGKDVLKMQAVMPF